MSVLIASLLLSSTPTLVQSTSEAEPVFQYAILNEGFPVPEEAPRLFCGFVTDDGYTLDEMQSSFNPATDLIEGVICSQDPDELANELLAESAERRSVEDEIFSLFGDVWLQPLDDETIEGI